jgi:type IV pilus assembly protein PilM
MNAVKNGLSLFTGDLPVGGEAFTERLAEELKISYDEAETLKVTGSRGAKSVDLEAVFQPLCHSLAEDIGRTLSLYATMAGEDGIHSVYLSGGGAKVPCVASLLEARLRVPVKLCEPFRSFSLARSIDKDLLAESALALAIGAGLATRRPGDK